VSGPAAKRRATQGLPGLMYDCAVRRFCMSAEPNAARNPDDLRQDGEMEQTVDEIRRLQGCINDLISVQALPAMWTGQEPAQIVSTLLDVLIGVLRLDFAYARLKDPAGESPIEMLRLAQSGNRTASPQEIGQLLKPCLGDDPQKWPLLVRNPIGDGDVSIVPLRLGLRDEIGVIVAGSQRADFPGETESLLLKVAANQAAIGLQEARLLSEQKRVAEELDQRVAQRTSQLLAANEELEKEIAEREQAEEKLRASEAYLAEAQRLTHTASWARKVATEEITHSSEEHSRLYGFDPEKGVPSFEALYQRVHPEDRDSGFETYDRAVAERTDFEVDYRTVLPDGTIKYLHAIGHPVFNASGELVEYIGTVMDVTERTRAEEELRASEQVTRGQVEALAQSLDVLATAPAPDQFIGQMLGTICRQLNGQSVALWLLDEANESLALRLVVEGENLAPSDSQHPFVRNPGVWKQNQVLEDLIFTGAPAVFEDIETDPRVSVDFREYFKLSGTKKSVAVPILASGKVKGVISVRHGDRPPYRREEIELLQALAHQVMLAFRLTELAEQSRRAAILEERNRMARDIHDTLAQGFTGVIMQLEAAEKAIECRRPKLVDECLRRAGSLARQSLSEARRSVHALRPEALQESSFWDALKEMIKSITVGTALRASFKAQGKVEQLPPVWQENLLRIGQEALANTIKYAHAHKFGTRLIYDPKELRLEFSDDGDGFKPQDPHDGSGLAGMLERVEQMGGELKITSSRGKGTKISVVLPCNGESTL
jgi:PAS domain S-box-containing protein